MIFLGTTRAKANWRSKGLGILVIHIPAVRLRLGGFLPSGLENNQKATKNEF